jgi:hypothetical protein
VDRYIFYILDVFAEEKYAGNQLAVVGDAAAHKLGLVDNQINVKMPGGDLLIEISNDEEICLTGPVEGVFQGCFHKDLSDKVFTAQ